MAKWNVGPPKKKGRYHIAHIDQVESDKPIVSECLYDGKSDWVTGHDVEPDEMVPNRSEAIEWSLDLHHIEAHKPYPTITRAWIKHLKETKRA